MFDATIQFKRAKLRVFDQDRLLKLIRMSVKFRVRIDDPGQTFEQCPMAAEVRITDEPRMNAKDGIGLNSFHEPLEFVARNGLKHIKLALLQRPALTLQRSNANCSVHRSSRP